MKEVKFDSRNAWGLGDKGTLKFFNDNVYIRQAQSFGRKGRISYYSDYYVKVGLDDYPEFTIRIDGRVDDNKTVYIYRLGSSYRAYFKPTDKPFDFTIEGENVELFKTINY